MTVKHTDPIYFKVATPVRDRLDALVERYDATLTSMARMALILGIEALERLAAETPSGVPATDDPP